MDRERIHRWLSESAYWALGRTRERMDAAIDNSLNLGIFDEHGEQLAYARVVTDRAHFAWLCDVFVAEDARGTGLGKALMQFVIDTLEPFDLKRIMLVTKDAHGLYEQFGFTTPDAPAWVMVRTGSTN